MNCVVLLIQRQGSVRISPSLLELNFAGAKMKKNMFFASVVMFDAYCNEYSKFIIAKKYDAMTRQAKIEFNFA
jgi:hypothetical protein